ncbi:MAG: hypothetical protein G8D58_04195, partial [gamma proteobacterium symbiont of Phacoides pectinatus]
RGSNGCRVGESILGTGMSQNLSRGSDTLASLCLCTAGLPSCAGVALEIDRLLMCLCGARHIEQVLAFPWSGPDRDVMVRLPRPASFAGQITMTFAPSRELKWVEVAWV